MIISDIASTNTTGLTYCHVLIARDSLIKVGDANLLAFLGRVNGIYFNDFIHPDYVREFSDVIRNLSFGQKERLLIFIKDDKGEYHLADVYVSNNGRTLMDLELMDMDIYNVRSVEARHLKMGNSLQKYRSMLSIYGDYLFDYDSEQDEFAVFKYIGSKPSELFQGSLKEYKEHVLAMLDTEQDVIDFMNFYNSVAKATMDYIGKVRIPLGNTKEKLTFCQVNSRVMFKYNKSPVVVGVLRTDIKEDCREEKYYNTAEAKDPATGLLNKRACHEYSVDILNMGDDSVHYMGIIDIDNFKIINDTYGHMFGDLVIATVADVLNSSFNGQGIVGRFGGDEFYFLTNKVETELKLRTILVAMRQKIISVTNQMMEGFRVTLSIGVSLFSSDGDNYDELFKKADKCLYIAKEKGKNRFVIYDEEKHGSLQEDSRVLRYMINPIDKAEYLSGVVADMSETLFDKGEEVIPDTLSSICENFDIDGVRIYLEGHEGTLYCSGKYKMVPRVEKELNNQFVEAYNKNHCLMLGNIVHFEGKNREFVRLSMEANIMGLCSYYYEKKDGNRLFIFFDVFNHSARWQESDKNYLMTLAKIISKVLDR